MDDNLKNQGKDQIKSVQEEQHDTESNNIDLKSPNNQVGGQDQHGDDCVSEKQPSELCKKIERSSTKKRGLSEIQSNQLQDADSDSVEETSALKSGKRLKVEPLSLQAEGEDKSKGHLASECQTNEVTNEQNEVIEDIVSQSETNQPNTNQPDQDHQDIKLNPQNEPEQENAEEEQDNKMVDEQEKSDGLSQRFKNVSIDQADGANQQLSINQQEKISQQKKAQAQPDPSNQEDTEVAKAAAAGAEDPEIRPREQSQEKDIESPNSKCVEGQGGDQPCPEEQIEVRSSTNKEAASSQGTEVLPEYHFEVIELEKHEPLQTTFEDGEQINVVQMFYPDKCPQGQRKGNVFLCNQQLYRRAHSDGRVTLIWALHNIGSDDFLNKLNVPAHYVESGVFESIEGITWQLRLEPGIWPIKSQSQGAQGTPQQQISTKSTRSKIELVAIPTEQEIADKRINRRIEVKFSTFHLNGELHTQKDWYREYDYKDEGDVSPAPIIYDQFCVFPQPRTMKQNLLSEQFCMQVEILNKLPKERMPVKAQPEVSSASGSIDEKSKDEKGAPNMQSNQFKGLMNEGTTCYLNSVIQALFFIRPFRNAVYKMPTITIEVDPKKLESSIPFCLQRIFYNLQLGNSSFVRTHELLQAFGWNSQDINQQQDVNEFNCILSDQLDKQMQNTPVQGTFNRLFEGEAQNVIKCINVEYESARDDKFNTIQLRVRGNNTIEDSVRQYVKEERLEGQNQYQTDDFGKQDALKFIRFKKLPPVLQISLQRYEYDLNVQQIVKENLKFEFKDVLDLEQILPSVPKERSEITGTEVVNKYHLHSILVHRGTANAGHYYAFIKPTLEDHWYEFNDSKVSAVGRGYAFGQGIGGNLSSFEFPRQTMYKESTGQLIERLKENFANAYMLIYVRETEREAIMCDKLTIDEQVPMELQMHFRTEELFKDQIQQDYEYFESTRFGKLQLMSAETLEHADWDGPFLCQKFKDEKQPWKFKFESDQKQHMALYVNKNISVNEFIIMLKNRLFPHDDNVELEDIWLYRVQINKNQKACCHFYYTLNRNVYSIEDKYECPLFSVRQSWDAQDWQQEQKTSTKWKKTMLLNQITRLIVINPLKLDPRTGKPYSVLHKMGEQETEAYKEHYNLFIEYIKKTDMMQGTYYLGMYNTFNDCRYSFSEFDEVKAPKDSGNSDSKVSERRDAIDDEQEMNQEMPIEESHIDSGKAPAAGHTGPGSIFGPIDEIRRSIQRYRDKFVFDYDKSLAEQQRKDHEEFISKQDNQMEPAKEDSELELARNQSRLYLVFVKVADVEECRLRMKGMLFLNLDRPMDLKDLQRKAGLSDEEVQGFDLFIEPYSTPMVRHHLDNDKRAGQFKQEQYLERGLTQLKRSSFDIFRVEPDKIQNVPLKEFVKPSVEGLCFTYFPNRVRRQNERGEEQPTLPPVHHYSLLVASLVNRGYVRVCYLSDQDITKNAMHEMVLGYHQFNYQDSFEAVVQRVARICRQFGLDVLVGSQQNLLNHIQLFDEDIKVVSFQDATHNPIYAENKQTLENLVTEAFYLNFTVHQIPFSKIDRHAETRFIQFLADEVVPTGKQPYQSLKILRESAVKDFLHEWQRGGKNSGVYLTMELDRETGTITKIFKEQTPMTAIVGSRKCLSITNVPTILRLNEVKSDEVARINDIIHESGSQNCCFAFVWIYDQYKKKREQYKQFAIPFNKQNDTFGDIIEQTKVKLEQLKRKQSNNLELVDIESLRMWTVKYNNQFVIQKQRVCYLDDFDWRNPMLQYEVNQLSQVAALNLCQEYPNNANEMYQPYSVNANKNGHGWFHFVYLAAQLNFGEPPDSTNKPKDAKRPSNVGGFSINNQN